MRSIQSLTTARLGCVGILMVCIPSRVRYQGTTLTIYPIAVCECRSFTMRNFPTSKILYHFHIYNLCIINHGCMYFRSKTLNAYVKATVLSALLCSITSQIQILSIHSRQLVLTISERDQGHQGVRRIG